jgi:hypothetical protein
LCFKASGLTKNALGYGGALYTGLEAYVNKGYLSKGDWAKVIIGIGSTASPYGWIYSVIDLGVQAGTHTSLTDRIGAGVDNEDKFW